MFDLDTFDDSFEKLREAEEKRQLLLKGNIFEVLKKFPLPNGVLNVEAFKVPKRFDDFDAFHLNFGSCDEIRKLDDDSYDYYFDLIDASSSGNENSDNFIFMSFNDLLENETSVCVTCANETHLVSDYGSENIIDMVETFQNVEKYLTTTFRFNEKEELSFLHEIAYLQGVVEFKEPVRKLLTEVFRLVSSERFKTETDKFQVQEEVLNHLITNNKDVSEISFESFIIFDSHKSFFPTSASGFELALKVYTYPGFIPGRFSILPEGIGRFFVNNFYYPGVDFVKVDSEVESKVLETMEILYTQNNAIFSNYEKLFEVASTL